MDDAKVTCNDCGFEWYGDTAAHALRTIGRCMKCRGDLTFHDEAVLPPLVEEMALAADVPAHLVLGNPRF